MRKTCPIETLQHLPQSRFTGSQFTAQVLRSFARTRMILSPILSI
jgi:hypothetical protein